VPADGQESTDRHQATKRGGGFWGGGGATRAAGRRSRTKSRDIIPAVAVILAILLAILSGIRRCSARPTSGPMGRSPARVGRSRPTRAGA